MVTHRLNWLGSTHLWVSKKNYYYADVYKLIKIRKNKMFLFIIPTYSYLGSKHELNYIILKCTQGK